MGNKNRVKAVALICGALVMLVFIWFFMTGIEDLIRKHMAADLSDEDSAEQTEETLPVQGSVKLDGKTYTYDHEFENWLFIGTDNSGNEDGEGEDYHGAMADFLLLAIVDKTDGNYAFLQLNRDTITPVVMLTSTGVKQSILNTQLCAAHWYGGDPEQSCYNTADAVSRMLGNLRIDGYYSMNMESIAALNHAVGGVEVLIEDDFSEADPTLKQGERIVLNDEQAHNFVRGRMNVGDGGNEGRMRRQKQYMEAFFAKAKARISEDPSFANELYSEMEDVSVSSMSGKDLSRLMKEVKDAESRGIYQIEGETKRGYDMSDGQYHAEFYPNDGAVREVLTELFHLTEAAEEEE